MKCDERRPICGKCALHQSYCVYVDKKHIKRTLAPILGRNLALHRGQAVDQAFDRFYHQFVASTPPQDRAFWVDLVLPASQSDEVVLHAALAVVHCATYRWLILWSLV